MKRRKKVIQPMEKPTWQLLPMADIVLIVRGWEKLKILRKQNKELPEGIRFEEIVVVGPHHIRQLDAIIPDARRRAESWLKYPGPIPARQVVNPDGITVWKSVIDLWELYLAVCSLADQPNKARWIASLPTEARRLLLRVRLQLKQPIA